MPKLFPSPQRLIPQAKRTQPPPHKEGEANHYWSVLRQLLVQGSNHYWFRMQTTISLPPHTNSASRANNYCFTFTPLLLHTREQPILVGGLSYIGSRRDQYRYIPSTYIGQPADQYRFTSPPHGGRANGPIRHSGLPSVRDTKRPHEEGNTDSASAPTEVGRKGLLFYNILGCQTV